MKILLDECMPRQLKTDLAGHETRTVVEMGWAATKNGALLRLAETQFDVFLAVDRRILQQQNLSTFQIALIVLGARKNSVEALRPLIPRVLVALQTIKSGDIVEIKA